jgi:hypothetical protein
MSYSAAISRESPTCLLVLIDQSTSMRERMSGAVSKAQFLCDVINRTLYTLIITCTRHDGIRDYFHAGVIAYSGRTRDRGIAGNALKGALGNSVLHPLSRLAQSPLRVEVRQRAIVADSDEVVHQAVRFPVWVEPHSQGWTGMCAGLGMAHQTLTEWVRAHPTSYPPTVLHITDGHPTDGDPEPVANLLRKVMTEDGSGLLFNLHVDQGLGLSYAFPHDSGGLPNKYAVKLFHMSSELPVPIVTYARHRGLPLREGARGFVYNADVSHIVEFFDLGTRAQVA